MSAEMYAKEAKGFTAVRADTFPFLMNALDVLV
jgi:hypothetical protein